jgi:methyltransferase family protein
MATNARLAAGALQNPVLTDRLKQLLAAPENGVPSVAPEPLPAAIPADPALAWVPPGHFYSPIPSADDRRRATRVRELPREIPGVDLQEDAQRALLEKMLPLYGSLGFTAEPGRRRYHYENTFYSYSDAVHYALMLLHHQPRRVIEVGSGYSSALLLDIAEQTASDRPIDMTFVEPYPDELAALARPGDLDGRLVQSGVQDVELSRFTALEAGDFLFIDSTHVAKAGSDVNYLYFEVLPRLASGVFVHVHDIFYPFEYPSDWINEGRSWNEAYVLRAFLEHNDAFEIVLFNTFLQSFHEAWYAANMPLCLKNRGGSIWLRRV